MAFICFLIAYAQAFYLYGAYGEIGELIIAFIFPIYYFVLTVVAVVMMHSLIITKRPYIVMSILSIGFMLVMWIVYICVTVTQKDGGGFFDDALWFPIVMTVLSLIMSLCYVRLIIDIVKVDKEIKRNTENNTN